MAGDDEPTAAEATRREVPQRRTPPDQATPLARGTRIGRYVIDDTLGRGGMGIVYTAMDPELVRKVALKLVRPGGGAESQARLVREAQAMARLAHPNVVAIYDVGTHEGNVFLAMELVAGETLRHWLKKQPRSWPEILAVFLGAGRGLAAAHASGIIHRDFKLDNVLVDAQGRARVLDFGLARAANEVVEPQSPSSSSDSLGSELTVTGAVMGTPAYMAPEQRSAKGADARADEYSFCVSLYEALYGERPVDSKGALREPPQGTKVPARLRRILLRGMSRDPEQRWPNMDALLAELARDPARKLRIAAVATAGAAGLAAVLAFAFARGDTEGRLCETPSAALGDAWSTVRRNAAHAAFAKTGKPFAETAFTTTAANVSRVAEAWQTAYGQACSERTKQNEDQTLLRMACLERQRIELAAFVELLVTADPKIVELSVAASHNLADPRDCADARSLSMADKLPADPKVRAEIEALRRELAVTSALPSVGRPRDAIKRVEPITVRAKQLGYRPLEAEAFWALGLALQAQGDYKKAIGAFESTVHAAEAGRVDRLAVRAAARIISLMGLTTQLEAGRVWVQRAQSMLERIGGDRIAEADVLFSTAFFDLYTGYPQKSITNLEKVLQVRSELLGTDHTETLLVHVNLGGAYDDLAQPANTIKHSEAAITGFERTLGPDHPRLVIALANLGLAYMKTGDIDRAERVSSRGHAIALASLGPRSYKTGLVKLIVSRLQLERGDLDGALKTAREAKEVLAETGGPKSEPYGTAVGVEARVLLAQGKARAAEPLLEFAVPIHEPASRSELAEFQTALGETRLALGKRKQALEILERALKPGRLPRYPRDVARTQFVTAKALVAARGDRKRARELAQQARATLAALPHGEVLVAPIDAFLAKLR